MSRAFTIVEVLIVMAVLSILTGAVIVVVNPGERLASARDDTREVHLNSIWHSTEQKINTDRGWKESGDCVSLPNGERRIADGTAYGNQYDLYSCIYPRYITEPLYDPSTGYYNNENDYDSGYYIYRDDDGDISLRAEGETSSVTVGSPTSLTVETQNADIIGEDSVDLNGEIISTGGSTILDAWFAWSENPDLTGHQETSKQSFNSAQAFSHTLDSSDGMTNGDTYYFQARTESENEYDEGDIVSVAIDPVYDLTTSSGTGGSVTTPGEGTYTYDENEVVTIEASPSAGYVFDSWTGDTASVGSTTSSSTTILMDGPYSIQATFTQQHDLTTSSGTGGSVTTPGEGTYTYDENEVVTIEASPSAGYVFDSWTGDTTSVGSTTSSSTTILMDGPYSIQATFKEPEYDLTMTADGMGSVTPSGTSTQTAGDDISINAESTDEWWEFMDWSATSGSFLNAGESSTTFTMPSEDTTVTGNFGEITYGLGGEYLFSIPSAQHSSAAWSNDGNMFATHEGNSLVFYDAPDFDTVHTQVTVSDLAKANEITYSPNDDYVAIIGENSNTDASAWIISTSTYTVEDVIVRTDHNRFFTGDFSPDGSTLALVYRDVYLYDTNTWSLQQEITDTPSFNVFEARYSNDGSLFAFPLESSPGWDGLVIYETTNWTREFTWSSHAADLNGVSWSPDDLQLAVTGDSDGLMIFDTTTWNITNQLSTDHHKGVSWSKDGSRVVVSTYNGSTDVYSTSTWSIIDTLQSNRHKLGYSSYGLLYATRPISSTADAFIIGSRNVE